MLGLLTHSADPNLRDDRGMTALHKAAALGHTGAAEDLLKAKADPERKLQVGPAAGRLCQPLAAGLGHSFAEGHVWLGWGLSTLKKWLSSWLHLIKVKRARVQPGGGLPLIACPLSRGKPHELGAALQGQGETGIRLHICQGLRQAALEFLAEAYHWFTCRSIRRIPQVQAGTCADLIVGHEGALML